VIARRRIAKRFGVTEHAVRRIEEQGLQGEWPTSAKLSPCTAVLPTTFCAISIRAWGKEAHGHADHKYQYDPGPFSHGNLLSRFSFPFPLAYQFVKRHAQRGGEPVQHADAGIARLHELES
jgi:hypothetical protein